MAYLSKVRLPDGSEYDLKDADARSDMDSLVSGLDDAIQLLNGWNGVVAENWTLTMSDGTTQTRVVLNQQEESNG